MQARLATTAAATYDFSEVYAAYFDHVWTYLRRLGVPPPLIDDAVQDVFVVCHRRLAEFEGRSTIRTWLFGIARRIAFRYHRREARAAQKHAAMWREATPTPEHLDDDLGRAQAGEMLDQFLDSLDDDKREVFVLAELESYSRTQLGEALGISPGTAYNRLRAARRRFEERFRHSPWQPHIRACAQRPEVPPPAARQRTWAALVPCLGLGETTVATGVERSYPADSELGEHLVTGGGEAWLSPATTSMGAASVAKVGALVAAGALAAWFVFNPVRFDVPAPQRDAAPIVAAAEVDDSEEDSGPGALDRVDAVDQRGQPTTVALAGIGSASAPGHESSALAMQPPSGHKLRGPAGGPSTTKSAAPRPSNDASRRAGDQRGTTTRDAASSQLGAEVDLLARAHRLAGRAAGAHRALKLLDQHAHRFPNSAFAPERAASQITALCRLGRGDEARAVAERMRRDFPSAPMQDAARLQCEAESDD